MFLQIVFRPRWSWLKNSVVLSCKILAIISMGPRALSHKGEVTLDPNSVSRAGSFGPIHPINPNDPQHGHGDTVWNLNPPVALPHLIHYSHHASDYRCYRCRCIYFHQQFVKRRLTLDIKALSGYQPPSRFRKKGIMSLLLRKHSRMILNRSDTQASGQWANVSSFGLFASLLTYVVGGSPR